MKNKKLKAIAVGAVVMVVIILMFWQNEVVGSFFESKVSNNTVALDSNDNVKDYDIGRSVMLGLILQKYDFNDRFIQQVEEETGQSELLEIEKLIKENEKEIYKIIKGENGSGEKGFLPETTYSIDKSVVSNRQVELPVSYLCQNPELPTGCEVTSLTTVLNYLGYQVSKETMADHYLPKCSLGEGSFWNYFLGDPRDEHSFGCYSAPIVTAANSYLKQQGSSYSAYNCSGSEFEVFLKEIEAGNPVLLWSTMYLEKAYITVEWTVNSEQVKWIAPEHCVVMIGYNLDANTVTISDPLRGIVSLDMDTVCLRYRQMCQQAVVIKNNVTEEQSENEAAQETTQATQQEETTQATTQATTQETTQQTTQATTEDTTKDTTEYITE